ncbi:hypothetical protein N665_2771s0001 [Sinapis alba]|nr:hypothetical protein N665_2771s0001 [Sinapis alba]
MDEVVGQPSQGEVPSSSPLSTPVNGGSWVGAVQGQKVLKKYEVEVMMKDGVGSVNVPEEITKDAIPLWDDFLIGKFLASAPHIAKIHAIVNKIWALSDKSKMIDVFEVNATTMKFRISDPVIRNRILRRGMWNLAEVPVVMKKWAPFVEKKEAEKESIPMWVHMKNVPLNMISWKGLSFISSPLGTPVRLHPETAQCTNLKVAKIFVKVDLTKDMPRSMNFNIQGKDTLVEYIYPWLPTKCSVCTKWGHMAKNCLANPIRQQEMQKDLQVHAKQSSEEVNGEKDLEAEDSEQTLAHHTEPLTEANEGVVNNGLEVNLNDSANDKDEDSGNNQEGDQALAEEQGWSDVTPAKASRSPKNPKKTLEFGQVSILSNSRFSVLSPTEEEGEILDQTQFEQEEKSADKKIVEQRVGDHMDDGVEVVVAGELAKVMTEEEKVADSVNDTRIINAKQKEKEVVVPRQSLPRGSKENHKFLGDTSVQKARDIGPSGLNKKNYRRNQ